MSETTEYAQVGELLVGLDDKADVMMLSDGKGKTIIVSGASFWQYVAECVKAEQITSSNDFLESQSVMSYCPLIARRPFEY